MRCWIFCVLFVFVCTPLRVTGQDWVQFDHNGDDCVSVADLVLLLGHFGQGNCNGAWSCGAPLSHAGHDYATVEANGNCWFAENLQTLVYANGDSIPHALADDEWETTVEGASAVYGEGESLCGHQSPTIDACDDAQSLLEYGRLYKRNAVADPRGLCPSGWHVATKSEWEWLVSSYGDDDAAGNAIKSSTGWWGDGGGVNSSGLNITPGGKRVWSGNFSSAGFDTDFWTSAPEGEDPFSWYWMFNIEWDNDIGAYEANAGSGYSVRCVLDAE